jgi:hypothetical protein
MTDTQIIEKCNRLKEIISEEIYNPNTNWERRNLENDLCQFTDFYNGTPHEINFYYGEDVEFKPEIRKYVVLPNKTAWKTVPSNGMLSASFAELDEELIFGCIPLKRKIATKVDVLPTFNGLDYKAIIVSYVYVAALKELGQNPKNVYGLCDLVYDETGRTVIGCIGLSVL